MDSYYDELRSLVKAALSEDIGPGDLTSIAALEPNPIKAKVVAKCDGFLSGIKPAMLVFDIVDSANRITACKEDGEHFASGDKIIEIDGFNQTVLASERTALNFIAHLSGIATLTSQFVALTKPPCKIIDTRKTTPGWRRLEKAAVVHGGGTNHRMGLYDMVLIKDNHIASCGSITAAVKQTREFMSTADYRLQFELAADEVKIEVEVVSEEQLREAIAVGVDRIMLDNRSVDQMKAMVAVARELKPEIELEASGNVSLDNVAAISETGVDFISIGALTHSAPAADFSLLVD